MNFLRNDASGLPGYRVYRARRRRRRVLRRTRVHGCRSRGRLSASYVKSVLRRIVSPRRRWVGRDSCFFFFFFYCQPSSESSSNHFFAWFRSNRFDCFGKINYETYSRVVFFLLFRFSFTS